MTTTRPLRYRMRRLTGSLAIVALAASKITRVNAATAHGGHAKDPKPTVVLVHGAWADRSSWGRVVRGLRRDGYKVTAPANPLRSLSGDSDYLADYLGTLTGPIVLVGHSYGGAVITNAATGDPDIRALVYVNWDAPDEGQTVAALAGPDSALSVAGPTSIFDFVPSTLPPTPTTDLYLKTSTFLTALANGLPAVQAAVLAATQRPVTLGALNEPSGEPAWRTIPSWFLVGTRDRVIPASAQEAMAEHAGATISRFNAGHLGLISDPAPVTRIIEQAAQATD